MAFSPQVRLRGDPYVGRRELRCRWRSAALEATIVGRARASRLFCARGRRGGTEVRVHRGTVTRPLHGRDRCSFIEAPLHGRYMTVTRRLQVLVHRGTGGRDVANTRLLSSRVVEARAWRAGGGAGSRDGVTVVQHGGCKSHLFASKLARSGEMAGLLDLAVDRHRAARGWPKPVAASPGQQ